MRRCIKQNLPAVESACPVPGPCIPAASANHLPYSLQKLPSVRFQENFYLLDFDPNALHIHVCIHFVSFPSPPLFFLKSIPEPLWGKTGR